MDAASLHVDSGSSFAWTLICSVVVVGGGGVGGGGGGMSFGCW